MIEGWIWWRISCSVLLFFQASAYGEGRVNMMKIFWNPGFEDCCSCFFLVKSRFLNFFLINFFLKKCKGWNIFIYVALIKLIKNEIKATRHATSKILYSHLPCCTLRGRMQRILKLQGGIYENFFYREVSQNSLILQGVNAY
jgi:hypothetical protein